jgi:hypothetical protein
MKKASLKQVKSVVVAGAMTELSAAQAAHVIGGATAIEYGATAIEYAATAIEYSATAIEYGRLVKVPSFKSAFTRF